MKTKFAQRAGSCAKAVCLAWAAGALPFADAAPTVTAGPWRPAACPPLAERGSGPSNLKVKGPCGFEFRGLATCEKEGDDLLVSVVRDAKNAAEVMLYINVERYVGPGTYKPPNDIWVSLKDGPTIYRWLNNSFEVTVGPGSKYVTLREVRLDPELVLVGCTGPQTNYQCDGRGDEPRHMQTVTTVAGTVYCKAAAGAKKK